MKYLNLFPLLISSSALLGAYYFQYFEGLEPCQLCIWQRIPHYFIVAFYTLFLIRRYYKIFFAIGFASFINIFISLYHVGVEKKIFSGLSSCGSDSLIGLTPEELIVKLSSTPTAKCNFVAWELLSISMAGWNAILSLISFCVIVYDIKR